MDSSAILCTGTERLVDFVLTELHLSPVLGPALYMHLRSALCIGLYVGIRVGEARGAKGAAS